MGQDTRTSMLDAQIVVEEVLDVLRDVPGFQGMRHLWIAHLREWPSKVTPVGHDQISAATLSLISRAEWPTLEGGELRRELTKLYEAGWCNHSIMHMLDHNPDGTRVAPWNNGKDKRTAGLVDYVRRRLRAWSASERASSADIDQAIPAPAVQAVGFAEWAMRMHEVYGELLRSERSERPVMDHAEAANDKTRRRRALSVDRVRQRGDRMASAMELVTSLLMQDARERGPARTSSAGSTQDSSDLLPAGNELALLRDEHVLRALREFVGTPERTHSHSRALRIAVTRARRASVAGQPISYSEVAKLESTIRGVDGKPTSHSTLHFLLERAR